MPWSIPTYAGTYMGGSPSAARVALFELCRAVNERQDAVGITKTQFYKADGTLASDVASADFAGIQASGPGCNAFLNLKKIRDAVVAMANSGKFTTTSGGTTVLTKALLETAIGDDIDADPIRPQEARFWQAMQDALDALIYGKAVVTPATSWTGASQLRAASGSPATMQAAWASAIADTPAISSIPVAEWTARASSPDAGIWDTAFNRYDLSNYSGSVVAGSFQVNHFSECSSAVNWRVGPVYGLLGSGTVASPTTDTSTYYWTGTYSTGGNLDLDIEILTSIPSLVPFSSPGGRVSIVQPYAATFYIDLASVLSDQ